MWAKMRFPNGKQTKKCFRLCERALRQSVPEGVIKNRLSRMQQFDYTIWKWRWDSATELLLHLKGDRMEIHVPSNLPRMEGVANRWTRSHIHIKAERFVQVCTVGGVEPAVVTVVSNMCTPMGEEMPEWIGEVL